MLWTTLPVAYFNTLISLLERVCQGKRLRVAFEHIETLGVKSIAAYAEQLVTAS